MAIKFYGKSKEVARQVVDQFKTGSLPDALAPVYIHRDDDVPSRQWSYRNQFIMAIMGTMDARGFQQWKKAGRRVMKGERAFHILAPCMIKTEDDEGTEYHRLIGFRSVPVFRIESTEVFDEELWSKHGCDIAEEDRLSNLPLADVAEAWGVKLTSYNGEQASYLGRYTRRWDGSTKSIALGVENLATWCHELMHAADDRAGTITSGGGQKTDNEIVAELGGATLLKMMGEEHEADLGGAWDYIKRYAKGDDGKAITLCSKLLTRVCGCLDLIMDEALGNGAELVEAA